jgi:hypothetical protein
MSELRRELTVLSTAERAGRIVTRTSFTAGSRVRSVALRQVAEARRTAGYWLSMDSRSF